MTRIEIIRNLVSSSLPTHVQRWDITAGPDGRVFEVLTDRTLTEAEEEAIILTSNLLPNEYMNFKELDPGVRVSESETAADHDRGLAKEYRVRGGTGRLTDSGEIAREPSLDSPEADAFWTSMIEPRIANGTHQVIFTFLR